ncbi:MAG: hypothetical protein ACSHW7_01440 [Patiriisocius sp.]|uniref:hypothetical protein n=1 Tax=Patiriisocius sp. TaxID=2822396 RepID=UPI003EF2A9E6
MKNLVLFLFALLISVVGIAQNGINYKALIKDADGDVVANQTITVQFSIIEGLATPVYQETHNPTTDANGIIIVNIGEGTVDSGNFVAINWGANDHYLNVQVDTGDGLTNLGTTEFKSVPYAQRALSAATVDNPVFFEPYILGVSSQTSNGRFSFNGKNGWQAANEMCKASYPNEPYARAFTNEQTTQAIIIENYSNNSNYNDQFFWAITSSSLFGVSSSTSNYSARNNGYHLSQNSPDFINGMRGKIRFDILSPGNGGGINIPRFFDLNITSNINASYPCLCGTYKPAN